MNFTAAIFSCYRNYFQLHGRAIRSEFWLFNLFTGLLGFARGLIHALSRVTPKPESTILLCLYAILVLAALSAAIPSIAVQVRRLHDVGRSGWWVGAMLLIFVATISTFVMFVFMRQHALLLTGLGLSVAAVVCGCAIFIFTLLPSQPGSNKYGPQYLA